MASSLDRNEITSEDLTLFLNSVSRTIQVAGLVSLKSERPGVQAESRMFLRIVVGSRGSSMGPTVGMPLSLTEYHLQSGYAVTSSAESKIDPKMMLA
jgi:hypothetical protein